MTAVTFLASLSGLWYSPTLPDFQQGERLPNPRVCFADLAFAISSKVPAWHRPDMQAHLGLGQVFLIRLKFGLPLTAAFVFFAALTVTGKLTLRLFHNFSHPNLAYRCPQLNWSKGIQVGFLTAQERSGRAQW
jgi:hypothetical protein